MLLKVLRLNLYFGEISKSVCNRYNFQPVTLVITSVMQVSPYCQLSTPLVFLSTTKVVQSFVSPGATPSTTLYPPLYQPSAEFWKPDQLSKLYLKLDRKEKKIFQNILTGSYQPWPVTDEIKLYCLVNT